MSLSLTKEEFLHRLEKDHKIILMGWEKDINEDLSTQFRAQITDRNEILITPIISEKFARVLSMLLLRAIDYVYEEDE